MRIQDLVELALGKEEAQKVDFAIPQAVFDDLAKRHPAVLEDRAGWYYDENNRVFGRLLGKTECWRRIREKIERDELVVVNPYEQ